MRRGAPSEAHLPRLEELRTYAMAHGANADDAAAALGSEFVGSSRRQHRSCKQADVGSNLGDAPRLADKALMSTRAFVFRAGCLQLDLGIRPPWGGEHSRQVSTIDGHLKELDCNLVVLESDYIDRDYMEDHSAFYARCLKAPKNSCERAHFFKLPTPGSYAGRSIQRKDVIDIRGQLLDKKAAYLGYVVIRPLRAAPVGRTALAPIRPEDHPCLRSYDAHLHGIDLHVESIVFQQQDRAVSACATAALWSSLSRLGSMEHMASLSPAAITTMASAFNGAGRVFPSDGLSIEQICRVVHAVGASPLVITCERDYQAALSYCGAALGSTLAPILLISAGGESEEIWHAVTVVGSRSTRVAPPSLAKNSAPAVFDKSRAIRILYVHDDRIGPFVPALVSKNDHGGCSIDLGGGEDSWRIQNIVVPTYHKVRFSLPELMATELRIAERMRRDRPINGVAVLRSRMILPLAEYLQKIPEQDIEECSKKSFSRYVGVVRFSVDNDTTDIVYDTTTAPGDPQHLAIVQTGSINEHGRLLRKWLRDTMLVDPPCLAKEISQHDHGSTH